MKNTTTTINGLEFNQDSSCFTVSHDRGYRIFNTQPLKEQLSMDFERGSGTSGDDHDGGLRITAMLFRCQYLALVGGGRWPRFPPNKVMIWDDHKRKFILELEFRSEVKAVKLRRDRVVVVLSNRVYVYSFSSQPRRLAVLETAENPQGLSALCSATENKLLAVPGRQPGHVQLVDAGVAMSSSVAPPLDIPSAGRPRIHTTGSVSTDGNITTLSSSPTTFLPTHIPSGEKPSNVASAAPLASATTTTTTPSTIATSTLIAAHSSPLAALAFNPSGTLLATASSKGTLIRIFETGSGRIVREFRRGADQAVIFNLSFSADSKWLCCGSDKGTVHIYSMELSGESPTSSGGSGIQSSQEFEFVSTASPHHSSNNLSWSAGNRHSSLAFMKDILPKYFSSEWSFATCQVQADTRFLCTFSPDQRSVIVITMRGDYYQFAFDPLTSGRGDCKRLAFHRFMDDD